MKQIIVLFIVLNFGFCFGQKKADKYLDMNQNIISKKEFYQKRNYDINVDVYVQTDSLIIGALIPRVNYGKLSDIELNQLRQYLGKISGKIFPSTHFIIINYLSSTPKKPYYGRKSHWTILDKSYTRKLKKMDNVSQIWVNNPDNVLLEYFHSDRINWNEDILRIIETTFFPFEIEFGSFAIINPNGNYLVRWAEYGPQNVFDFLETCKKL